MRAPHLIAAATFTLLLAACAPMLSRVRVNGDYDDVSAITGEWNGEYHSAELGRSGSIVFRFAAPEDSAFGDVVMLAGPMNQSLTPGDGPPSAFHPPVRSFATTGPETASLRTGEWKVSKR